MISALQTDEVLFFRPPKRVVVITHHTDRRVDGVGPAERKKHVIEVSRRQFGQLRSQADRRLAAEMEIAGGVRQSPHLFRGDGHDAFPAVAGVHAPKAGESVEKPMPGGVGHEAAVSRLEDRDAAQFMRSQRCDGMDEMGAIFLK